MHELTENIIITIIKVIPKEDCEEQVLSWFDSIAKTASGFTGFVKSEVFESPDKIKPKEVINIFRFDTYAHLVNWENSRERKTKLKEGETLFAGIKEHSKLTGLEFLFASTQTPASKSPAKWKMAVIMAVTIFILLNTLIVICQQLLTAIGFPTLIRSLLSIILLVAIMTYLVMPLLTKLFSGWLFKKA